MQRAVAALAARAGLAARARRSSGGRRASSRSASADRRHAPSQSARQRVGGHAGLSYGGACRADLRPARGRRARRRPAARARRRRHGQDDASLVERFAWLAEQAGRPEPILALTLGDGAADALRERVEDRLDACPTRSSTVTTFARPLRAAAARRGARGRASTRSRRRSRAADRLAMLLERIDELPLRHHDLRGNPSAMLGAIVRAHRPAQGRAGHAPPTTRAWAAALPRRGRARRARARVRRALRRPRPAAAEAGALDAGDLVLQRVPAAARAAARARAARGALPPRARRRAAGRELRPGPAAAAARRRARRDHRVRRRRPGDPPLPRRGDQEPPRLPRRVAAGDASCALDESLRRPARGRWPRRRAVVAPIADRLDKRAARAARAGGEVAFWRCATERAQAQAVAAEVERLLAREDVAPEDVCVLVRSVRERGPGGRRRRSRSAPCPTA